MLWYGMLWYGVVWYGMERKESSEYKVEWEEDRSQKTAGGEMERKGSLFHTFVQFRLSFCKRVRLSFLRG